MGYFIMAVKGKLRLCSAPTGRAPLSPKTSTPYNSTNLASNYINKPLFINIGAILVELQMGRI
jgi:hypothetical protein